MTRDVRRCDPIQRAQGVTDRRIEQHRGIGPYRPDSRCLTCSVVEPRPGDHRNRRREWCGRGPRQPASGARSDRHGSIPPDVERSPGNSVEHPRRNDDHLAVSQTERRDQAFGQPGSKVVQRRHRSGHRGGGQCVPSQSIEAERGRIDQLRDRGGRAEMVQSIPTTTDDNGCEVATDLDELDQSSIGSEGPAQHRHRQGCSSGRRSRGGSGQISHLGLPSADRAGKGDVRVAAAASFLEREPSPTEFGERCGQRCVVRWTHRRDRQRLSADTIRPAQHVDGTAAFERHRESEVGQPACMGRRAHPQIGGAHRHTMLVEHPEPGDDRSTCACAVVVDQPQAGRRQPCRRPMIGAALASSRRRRLQDAHAPGRPRPSRSRHRLRSRERRLPRTTSRGGPGRRPSRRPDRRTRRRRAASTATTTSVRRTRRSRPRWPTLPARPRRTPPALPRHGAARPWHRHRPGRPWPAADAPRPDR